MPSEKRTRSDEAVALASGVWNDPDWVASPDGVAEFWQPADITEAVTPQGDAVPPVGVVGEITPAVSAGPVASPSEQAALPVPAQPVSLSTSDAAPVDHAAVPDVQLQGATPPALPDPPAAPPVTPEPVAATPLNFAVAAAILAGLPTVSAAQISALVTNLRTYFGSIETALESKVFRETLPLIGSALGDAFANADQALTAFNRFQNAVLNTLSGFNAATDPATLQAAVDNAIRQLGLSGDNGGVTITVDGATGTVTVGFADAFTTSLSASLSTSIGLPGLGFQTQGTALTTLSYGLVASATVTTGGGFGISAPQGALKVGLSVTAPGFSGDASLGFINYHAHDAGSAITGSFSVDSGGNAAFQGTSNIKIGLTSDLGSAVLPSISAELDASASFTAATNGQVDPSNPSSFGTTPQITLSNVTYDFGSFLDNFLAPLMKQINAVIDPIRPALAVLDTDLTFLKDALGDNWKSLDTSGALNSQNQNAPDGKLSLLDFLNQPSGDPNDTPAFVKLIDTLNTISNFAAEFGGRSGSPDTPYDLGSFAVPGDVRDATLKIANQIPSLLGGTNQNLQTFLKSLATTYPTPDAASGTSEGGDISNLINNAEFSFPLLQNPTLAAQILLGGQADLFTLKVPPSFIGVGSFNADGSVNTSQTILALPIAVPPIPLSITPALSTAFGATVGLTFGYDTTGLAAYSAGHFADAGTIFKGFYIQNPGNNQPIVNLQAALQLSVSLSAPFVTIKPEGSIDGSVGVSLKSAGKVYLGPFLDTLQSNPASLFSLSGRLGGNVGIDINIGGADFSIRTPEFTLVDYGTTATDPNAPPRQTAVWNYPGLTGNWEEASNWVFATSTYEAAVLDFYGDVTIQANTNVTYFGTQRAIDLTSLSLGAGSLLEFAGNAINIDGRAINPHNGYVAASDGVVGNPGTAYGSINNGTIDLEQTALLLFDGDFTNNGVFQLGYNNYVNLAVNTPTVEIRSLLSLSGGGTVITQGAADWFVAPGSGVPGSVHSGAAELWNIDNVIRGGNTFELQVLNTGTIKADTAQTALFDGPLVNHGLIDAAFYAHTILQTLAGTVDFNTTGTIDNTSGVIEAEIGGLVAIESGQTVIGGQLKTDHVLPLGFGVIEARGSVVLNGGTAGMVIAGEVDAVDAVSAFGPVAGTGTLTLTGLITGASYSSAPGDSVIASHGDGVIILRGATLKGGELLSSGSGVVSVATASTLDGSLGLGSLALDANVQDATGAVLTLDGGITAGPDGGGITLSPGTITIGTATTGQASLGILSLGGGWTVQGVLYLDDTHDVVTGRDAKSTLVNSWLISGEGQLGNGRLGITNTGVGVIEDADTGGLVIDTGTLGLTNQGLIWSNFSVIGLVGFVQNAGGHILADGGYVTFGGGVIAGGLLSTAHGGTLFDFSPGETLDGTGSAVTLDVGASIVLSTQQALAGSIINHTVLNVAAVSTTTGTLSINGIVTLSGGGGITLNGGLITGGVFPSLLDNIDNTITGVGAIGGILGVSNEAAGVISAGGGVLAISVSAGNAGLIEAATGTIDLSGLVGNTGSGTVAADGGTVLLDQGIIRGGLVRSSAGGSIRVKGSGTLDGASGLLTVDTGSLVDAGGGATLTLAGAIANRGTIRVTGDKLHSLTTSLVLSGTVRLTGGGSVTLADAQGDGTSTYTVLKGAPGVLDNADNTISGIGRIIPAGITNEALGSIIASGGTLQLAIGAAVISNAGLLEALGGTLVLDSAVANSGSVVGNAGTVLLDGVAVRGGTLATTNAGRILVTSSSGTLDGSATAVTIAAGSQTGVQMGAVGSSETLFLKGSIVNHGTLLDINRSAVGGRAEITTQGTVTLSGGGTVLLADFSADLATIQTRFSGTVSTDVLDNIDNLISGYGLFGYTQLITNEAAGIIQAQGGLLRFDFYNDGAETNRGLIRGFGGTLDAFGTIYQTGGGTLAAAGNGLGHSGLLIIDGTIIGGTIASDPTDPGSVVQAGTRNATVDGTNGAVSITAGTNLLIGVGTSLVATGTLINAGTISIIADYASPVSSVYAVPQLAVAGTLRLQGGGQVLLSEKSGLTGVLDGRIGQATSGAVLDNTDNTIAGYGYLQTSVIINEAQGRILARGGTLVLNATSTPVTNTGVIGSNGGTLDLGAKVANTGGTIAANGGVVLIDGAVVQGGLLSTTAGGVIQAGYLGTLDGTGAAITLAAGSTVLTAAGTGDIYQSKSLIAGGQVINHGTFLVGSNTGNDSILEFLSGTTLSGGGQIVLADAAASSTFTNAWLQAATISGTLTNIDNTITGNGRIGGNTTLVVTNQQAGVISSGTATLSVASKIINTGLLLSNTGTLFINADVANAGGTVAADGGRVLVNSGHLISGGLVRDSGGGLVLGNGGTLDGAGSALTISTSSVVGAEALSGFNQALLGIQGSIVNHGTLIVAGNVAAGRQAFLRVTGNTVLTGGGTVLLTDLSGTATPVFTQLSGNDTSDVFDNADNLITGAGLFGGQQTTTNEASGIIQAQGGLLAFNYAGSSGVTVNKGLIRGLGTTLDVLGTIDGTAGGTIAAMSDGLGHSGTVLIDGSIRGGILSSDTTDPGSILQGGTNTLGTLDGTAGAVTLATGAHLAIGYNSTLKLTGTLANNGSISIASDNRLIYSTNYSIANLNVVGTAVLQGLGSITLSDANGASGNPAEEIVGGTGSVLDNVSNTISGYGRIYVTQLTNEAQGVITATGGTITVGGTIHNAGILRADGGTLVLNNAVLGSAGATPSRLEINALGSVIAYDTIDASQTVRFGGAGASLEVFTPSAFAALISNFAQGEQIKLDVSATVTGFSAGALNLTQSGGAKLALAFDGSHTLSDFKVVNNGSNTVITLACFAAGSLIRTGRGEMAVEALAVGDMVQAMGAGLAPIAWIGQRRIDCATWPVPEIAWPVRISADAFGPGRPHSDLFLSPEHAVFAGGVLVPVRHLINGQTITQVPVDDVHYFHIALASHDVVLANGLPCETLLDDSEFGRFDSEAGLPAGFAGISPFAPLITQGARLERIRRTLAGNPAQSRCLQHHLARL